MNDDCILYKDLILNYEPEAQFKLKDAITDFKKNLIRAFEANVHILFMEKGSELRKSKFLDILEKINTIGACSCPFEVINGLADEIFNGVETVEYDIELIVDKMKVSLDHGRVFSKLVVENKQIDSLKNFLESRVLQHMKINKCELN